MADAPKDEQKTLTLAAIVIGVACLGGMILLPRLARSSSKALHKPAPVFALPVVMNGEPGARISLGDLKGKPVLIDFWAFWCGPCKMEGPVVDRIAEKYKDRDLAVIGVSTDGQGEEVTAAARSAHMTYPILSDDRHEAQAAYGINTLPTLVVIDREGNVVNATTGFVDEGTLDDMVRDAL